MLKRLKHELKKLYGKESVFITAATGIAGKAPPQRDRAAWWPANPLLRPSPAGQGVQVTALPLLTLKPRPKKAVGIGGTTLHKFAGVGFGRGKRETIANKVKSSAKSSQRWKMAKALIIDEIRYGTKQFLSKDRG